MPEQSRPLYEIAREIRGDWKTVSPHARPYLSSMEQINSINDMYYCDPAKSVVLYFLSNAITWRGPVARRIKKELRAMCGLK